MTKFKPGHKFGKGRPPLDKDLEMARRMNKDEVERLLALIMKSPMTEVDKILQEPTSPAIAVMVASLVKKSITKGDPAILNFLLDRTIGKVKENIEIDARVTHEINRHDTILNLVPNAEIAKLVRLKPGDAGA